jgi:hypothetical protein
MPQQTFEHETGFQACGSRICWHSMFSVLHNVLAHIITMRESERRAKGVLGGECFRFLVRG